MRRDLSTFFFFQEERERRKRLLKRVEFLHRIKVSEHLCFGLWKFCLLEGRGELILLPFLFFLVELLVWILQVLCPWSQNHPACSSERLEAPTDSSVSPTEECQGCSQAPAEGAGWGWVGLGEVPALCAEGLRPPPLWGSCSCSYLEKTGSRRWKPKALKSDLWLFFC